MPPEEDEYLPADVVAHRIAVRQNHEAIAAVNAKWQRGQDRQAAARKSVADRLAAVAQPQPVTNASATKMAEEAESGEYSIAADMRRRDELREKAKWSAINAAKNPPERDPRTSAEIMAGDIAHARLRREGRESSQGSPEQRRNGRS